MVITFQPIIWISSAYSAENHRLVDLLGTAVDGVMSWVSQGRSPVESMLMQLATRCCAHPQPAAVDGRYRFLADGAGIAVA